MVEYVVVWMDRPRYPDSYRNEKLRGKQITMLWDLIPGKKMPPTRIARYCGAKLKEGGGDGRFVVIGVRWAESKRRKNSRAGIDIFPQRKSRKNQR